MKIKNIISFLKVLLLVLLYIIGFKVVQLNLITDYRDINTTLKGIEDVGNIVAGNKIETKVNGEILFLAMGIDAENVGDNVKNGIRTDTMMLVKVNYNTGKIKLMSIPRDSRIKVKNKLDKANHAHAYGGSKLVMKTIRDYTGLDIDYYVKVDYGIVKDLVNAIGGVKIDVPFHMKYDDVWAEPPLHIDIPKGEQILDGQNAINFLRFRHSNNYKVGYPEGDVGRIKMQHKFIKELVKQSANPKNVLNIGKLIKTYYDNVDTNIPFSEMIKGLTIVDKLNQDSLDNIIIPGNSKTINNISYFIPNEEELQSIIDKDFSEYKEYEVNEMNK